MKYGPIICDPTSEEAKALVGKFVAFSSFYTELKDHFGSALRGKLVSVNDDGFYDVNGYHHSFIREIIEEKPTYRPYESCEEMVEDFKKRFMHKAVQPAFMPLIWLRYKSVFSIELVQTFGDDGVRIDTNYLTFTEIFNEHTYLDGSPVGKEVKE